MHLGPCMGLAESPGVLLLRMTPSGGWFVYDCQRCLCDDVRASAV